MGSDLPDLCLPFLSDCEPTDFNKHHSETGSDVNARFMGSFRNSVEEELEDSKVSKFQTLNE